jgi:hypothetical protein
VFIYINVRGSESGPKISVKLVKKYKWIVFFLGDLLALKLYILIMMTAPLGIGEVWKMRLKQKSGLTSDVFS